MECMLKRLLPFLLTLIAGLMLGNFFSQRLTVYRDVAYLESHSSHNGIGTGMGRGCPMKAAEMREADVSGNPVFNTREVEQKARILSKPEAQYTDEARENAITGTVVLRGVLASNGEVTGLRTVSGLPFGLTEQALASARQIKFVPAMKDGKPVSQYIQIEYSFNLF